jgi:uncharacterized membrane protein
MLDGIAQIILAIGALLLEVTTWAIAGLYVGVRAITSSTHREKIRLEWHSGWKGKSSLLISGVFWGTIVGIAIYFWVPIRSSGL